MAQVEQLLGGELRLREQRRTVSAGPWASAAGGVLEADAGAFETTAAAPLHHEQLPGPLPAFPRLRRLFDPQSGWFRRLERDVSHVLSANVYPWIPGVGIPYALLLERYLTVSEAEVRIAGLPAGFDGAGVLLVTDVHAGPFLPPRALRLAFHRLMTLKPDLILLGGDLTTSRLAEIVPHLPAFGSLTAPLGVFGVLGNHDHYTGDPARLREMLEASGVRILHNSSVVLERGGGRIALAGIDDLYQGKPDLAAALAGRVPAVPTLLLSHNPDVFFQAGRAGVSLVLSGHTHGGQIRIPGLPVLVRQSRYRLDEGRYTAQGAEIVVSRGLGVSGIPLRLACAPEAVFLRLRPAPPLPTLGPSV